MLNFSQVGYISYFFEISHNIDQFTFLNINMNNTKMWFIQKRFWFKRKFNLIFFIFSVRIPSDSLDWGRMAHCNEVLDSSGTSWRNPEVRCQKDHRWWEPSLHHTLDCSNVGCIFWTVGCQPHIDNPLGVILA